MVCNLLKVNDAEYESDVNDVVMMSLFLALKRFTRSSSVFIVNSEKMPAEIIMMIIMMTLAMTKMLAELISQ